MGAYMSFENISEHFTAFKRPCELDYESSNKNKNLPPQTSNESLSHHTTNARTTNKLPHVSRERELIKN